MIPAMAIPPVPDDLIGVVDEHDDDQADFTIEKIAARPFEDQFAVIAEIVRRNRGAVLTPAIHKWVLANSSKVAAFTHSPAK